MMLPEFFTQLERRAAEAEREGATAPVANVYRLVPDELQAPDGRSATATSRWASHLDRGTNGTDDARRRETTS